MFEVVVQLYRKPLSSHFKSLFLAAAALNEKRGVYRHPFLVQSQVVVILFDPRSKSSSAVKFTDMRTSLKTQTCSLISLQRSVDLFVIICIVQTRIPTHLSRCDLKFCQTPNVLVNIQAPHGKVEF